MQGIDDGVLTLKRFPVGSSNSVSCRKDITISHKDMNLVQLPTPKKHCGLWGECTITSHPEPFCKACRHVLQDVADVRAVFEHGASWLLHLITTQFKNTFKNLGISTV